MSVSNPCQVSIGVCKVKAGERRKLILPARGNSFEAFFAARGSGYKVMGDPTQMVLQTSLLGANLTTPPPPPPPGTSPTWLVNVVLAFDVYSTDQYIDMEFTGSMLVSGLQIQTDRVNYLQQFTLEYVKFSILNPGTFDAIQVFPWTSIVGHQTRHGLAEVTVMSCLQDFHVFERANSSMPNETIFREIRFPYPVETRHLRLTVTEGAPNVAICLNLIGMATADRYNENPFLDPMLLTFRKFRVCNLANFTHLLYEHDRGRQCGTQYDHHVVEPGVHEPECRGLHHGQGHPGRQAAVACQRQR
jgi:hypothetical protein